MIRYCFLMFLLAPSVSISMASMSSEAPQTRAFIASIYQKPTPHLLADRIAAFSALFLEKPYLLGALGEGPQGVYDQFPLYRTDTFDCLTFVETIMALSLAKTPGTFEQCIQRIRYHQGNVSFISRNHFTDLDWNINNQQQGLIKDITATIHDQQQHPVADFAEALINKPAWYQKLPLSRIRLTAANEQQQQKQWQVLKREGKKLPVLTAKIAYLPWIALFDKKDQAREDILRQIPEGAIIEIVRPNWDLTAAIGTHLNVSHLGFAIWKQGQLYFRNASTVKAKVVDQLLSAYLREARKSPTIGGINIQVILPGQCTR